MSLANKCVLIGGLLLSSVALAEGQYECALGEQDAPASFVTGALVNGELQLKAGEYLGYINEDASKNEFIAAIAFKASEDADEEPLAIALTELGASKLYVGAYHNGKQIVAVCDKK